MLFARAVIIHRRRWVIHPALWAQWFFERTDTLDLYIEALSAAHVEGESVLINLTEGISHDK